jgi:hypothetical protein
LTLLLAIGVAYGVMTVVFLLEGSAMDGDLVLNMGVSQSLADQLELALDMGDCGAAREILERVPESYRSVKPDPNLLERDPSYSEVHARFQPLLGRAEQACREP